MSSSRDFIPPSNEGFQTWLRDFVAGITSQSASLGLTTQQLDNMGEYAGAFQASFALTSNAATRTSITIEQRRQKRDVAESYARELARIINAHPGVTNKTRLLLGLTPRKSESTPSSVPDCSPEVFLVAMRGHTMDIELRDADGRCRWPDGVRGATVLTRVGPTVALDPEAYTLQGNTTRTRVSVDFPRDLAPGTQVWVTAYYRNAIDESGNAANPVGAQINFGNVMGKPASLRMAA